MGRHFLCWFLNGSWYGCRAKTYSALRSCSYTFLAYREPTLIRRDTTKHAIATHNTYLKVFKKILVSKVLQINFLLRFKSKVYITLSLQWTNSSWASSFVLYIASTDFIMLGLVAASRIYRMHLKKNIHFQSTLSWRNFSCIDIIFYQLTKFFVFVLRAYIPNYIALNLCSEDK